MSKCRSCGAEIIWIRTKTGKSMPVDTKTERFLPDEQGNRVYVMNNGSVMKGVPVEPGDTRMEIKSGHTSHFATCPDAKKFRRKNG